MFKRLVLVVALAGCTPAQCELENLPNHGHAASPDDLAKIVQHEAHNECYARLYDMLSQRTRDKTGRTTWRLAASSIKIPDPYDYKVMDVIEKGSFLGAVPSPFDPDESMALYDYGEPGKKPLHAKILLRREAVEDAVGKEWRVAMQDQDDRVRAGDGRYWWFDEDVPDKR